MRFQMAFHGDIFLYDCSSCMNDDIFFFNNFSFLFELWMDWCNDNKCIDAFHWSDGAKMPANSWSIRCNLYVINSYPCASFTLPPPHIHYTHWLSLYGCFCLEWSLRCLPPPHLRVVWIWSCQCSTCFFDFILPLSIIFLACLHSFIITLCDL